MKKVYRGSCHCGGIRFEAELDLAPDGERSPPERSGVWWTSTFRCNCTLCLKTRFWKGFVRPEGFRLVDGMDFISDYQSGERVIHHYFCRRCGVHPFAEASLEVMGGDFYAVNIACLDDAAEAELARAPITYEDGRNDAWDRAPAHTRHL